MKTGDIIRIVAGVVLVFGLIWGTVLEFPNFSNTTDFFTVLWRGAAIWIPVSIGLSVVGAITLKAHWSHGLLIGLTIGVLSFPLFSSLINRVGMGSQVYEEQLVYLGMDARIKDRGVRKVGPIPEPDEYHVFLGEEDDPMRLIVAPDPYWLKLEPGQEVTVRWMPGRIAGRIYKGVIYSPDL